MILAIFHGFPFPQVNATLNGISACLLLLGYGFIRTRHVRSHVTCMLSAVLSSAVFLVSYITYHVTRDHPLTTFPVSRWRLPYLIILITHTILAIVILPLVFVTLRRAFRRQWHRHLRIARVTFPIWLYVSVTGVVVYWMLYHLAPTLIAGK